MGAGRQAGGPWPKHRRPHKHGPSLRESPYILLIGHAPLLPSTTYLAPIALKLSPPLSMPRPVRLAAAPLALAGSGGGGSSSGRPPAPFQDGPGGRRQHEAGVEVDL